MVEHAYPANHGQFMEWMYEFRAKAETEHAKRMKEWEHLLSPEYFQELNEQILNATHADMQPPWLQPIEEQDNDGSRDDSV